MGVALYAFTGADRTGICAALCEVLGQAGAEVLDMSQSLVHEHLYLGILVRLPEGAAGPALEKTLQERAGKLGLDMEAQPVTGAKYRHWAAARGQSRHTLTLLGRELSATAVSQVAAAVTGHGLNIDGISRLSGRPSLSGQQGTRTCLELAIRGEPSDPTALKHVLLGLADELQVDLALQKDDIARRNRRLVVFDMDSTLIDAEIVDELAKAAGVGEQVAAITEKAMAGGLDFGASLRERVGLLAGLEEEVLQELAGRLPLAEGAERLMRVLKSLGIRTAIVSGGFLYFAQHLGRRLGVDHVYGNVLEIRDGRLTGQVLEPLVDRERKAALLREIAQQEGIALEQTVAVGDGANDAEMLSIAGVGIAYRARSAAIQAADHALALGLDGILYLLGLRDWQAGIAVSEEEKSL